MTRLTLHGAAMYTEGSLPKAGQRAPRFTLADERLADVGLDDFAGRSTLLNIVPSLELPNCADFTLRLVEQTRSRPQALLVTVSADLPFAGRRFGAGDAQSRVLQLSCFRSPAFARAYGVSIVSGPLKGLPAPALLVIDGHGIVLHSQLLRELSAAPDIDAALAALPDERHAATFVAATPVASVAL